MNSGPLRRARQMEQQMASWRRLIHRHPEPAFEEFQTADLVAEVLEHLPGFMVRRGVGSPTSVVALLDTGRPGRHVALRADMDALPIQEDTGIDTPSEVGGMMHACGHDGHVAALLGAAHLIADDAAQGRLSGRVTLLFQPAEEAHDAQGKSGAVYLIEAGVLDGVDVVLALHANPQAPVGTIGLHDGAAMANIDDFTARIIGRGGHAGYPDQALDPLWLLVPVLEAIHGIRARRVSPIDGAAVSVCQINGGTANNVIPQHVDLAGTLRSYHDQTRELLLSELSRALNVAEALGGQVTVNVQHGEPSVVNAPAVNRILAHVVPQVLQRDAVWRGPFGMGGEDFGWMTRTVPGAMFFLGVGTEGLPPTSLHAPNFRLDETALSIGAAVFAESTRQLCKNHERFTASPDHG